MSHHRGGLQPEETEAAIDLQPDKQDSIDSDEYDAKKSTNQSNSTPQKAVAERSFTDIAKQMAS